MAGGERAADGALGGDRGGWWCQEGGASTGSSVERGRCQIGGGGRVEGKVKDTGVTRKKREGVRVHRGGVFYLLKFAEWV